MLDLHEGAACAFLAREASDARLFLQQMIHSLGQRGKTQIGQLGGNLCARLLPSEAAVDEDSQHCQPPAKLNIRE